ncbi:MAG: outer membrane beta-barrel protein [Pseudomonadota bacterium]
MKRRHLTSGIALAAALAASSAFAESELSFYTGYQIAPHSRVEGNDPGGVGAFSFLATWEGRPLEAPPYYGFRYTYWTNETLGFGVEFNHAKVYADDATLASSGFSRLEFTDGLNIITANVFRRWPGALANGNLTPYVGAGVGFAMPHVDVESSGGKTFEYQVTGPAAMIAAGVKYDFNERWGVFGEYKGTYSMNEASLSNGGTLSSDIVTNALNIGVSFSF